VNGEEASFALLGDRALLVTLGDTISEEINDLVLSLAAELKRGEVPGVSAVQPAYASLCVHFDPRRVNSSFLSKLIVETLKRISQFQKSDIAQKAREAGRIVEIPVAYGGENGPDLEWAEAFLGLSRDEIVRRHSGRLYRVYMIGFTPGFPYLGGMDESIALPRLGVPRKSVPSGSVGIAGTQTGVYPQETPGGWRIIGRTHLPLFTPEKDPPSLLKPGDHVRFVPIGPYGKRLSQEDISDACAKPGENLVRETDFATPQGLRYAPPGLSVAEQSLGVPGLEVEDPGFYTLVVDRGRPNYRDLGVPLSGALDLHSYCLANALLGNSRGEACLEFTLKGPVLRAKMDLWAAVTGAPAPVTVDGKRAPVNRPLFLPEGSVMEIGSLRNGLRGYLAVSGGILVPEILGSRSTYTKGSFGGFQGRPLKAGDVLPVNSGSAPPQMRSLPSPLPFERFSFTETMLRVIPGPEATQEALYLLTSQPYEVTPDSDRMGLRLDGPPIFHEKTDILSSPVVPGTIQVPSDGKPILLLADSQTTGGYKRIACVASQDLPLAGQLRPGTKVRFQLVFWPWIQWVSRTRIRHPN